MIFEFKLSYWQLLIAATHNQPKGDNNEILFGAIASDLHEPTLTVTPLQLGAN